MLCKLLAVAVLCLYTLLAPATGLQCYKCSDYLITTPDPRYKDDFQSFNNFCSFSEKDVTACNVTSDEGRMACVTATTYMTALAQGHTVSAVVVARECSVEGRNITDTCEDENLDGSAVTLLPSLSALGARLQTYSRKNCVCFTNKCNSQRLAVGSGTSTAILKFPISMSCVGLIVTLAVYTL